MAAQFADRFSILFTLANLCLLIAGQLVFPAHPDTADLCSFTAFGCSSLNQFSFEIRQTTENRQH
jgi:hypothetical protein